MRTRKLKWVMIALTGSNAICAGSKLWVSPFIPKELFGTTEESA
jgi:hypothetical protein